MPEQLLGIKILDLSRVLAGPYCTMMLGDLGASVIKVEKPGLGDDTRGWGPPFDEAGRSAYFLAVNRNKLSVTADFRIAEDREFLESLAMGADVVVENFLPGSLKRNGFDPDSIMAQNERLIWCNISGFGRESTRPGYDFVAQAESGWMSITGEPDGEPMKIGVALVDVLTGKDAAIGILSALASRDRAAGRGEILSAGERTVTVSLADTAAAALVNVAQNVLVSGKPAGRWGNAHPNLVPYQLFHAADRPIVLAVGNDEQWHRAMAVLGLHELAADPDLATNSGRIAARKRIVEAISTRLRSGNSEEWIAKLEGVGVPCGRVRSVAEAVDGTAASPLSGVPPVLNGRVRYNPPLLNEHGVTLREKHWSLFDMVPRLK